MTATIGARGAAAEAIERVVPQLVEQFVASRITAGDATLWGPEAEEEASKRLGWTQAVSVSRPLVDEILALRDAARSTLGPRFSYPEFHDRILENGAVTLESLRGVVGRWLESEGGGGPGAGG